MKIIFAAAARDLESVGQLDDLHLDISERDVVVALPISGASNDMKDHTRRNQMDKFCRKARRRDGARKEHLWMNG